MNVIKQSQLQQITMQKSRCHHTSVATAAPYSQPLGYRTDLIEPISTMATISMPMAK